MTRWYAWHDSIICVPWLNHMCAMTQSYVCHDSIICVPWLICTCVMTSSLISVTQLIHMYDMLRVYWVLEKKGELEGMKPWYVWHDSLTRVTWLTHTCVMTHSQVCHDLLICHIQTCDMPRVYRRFERRAELEGARHLLGSSDWGHVLFLGLCRPDYWGVLQWVAVCCSALQCVVVCCDCSVVQCGAVWCGVVHQVSFHFNTLKYIVLQCVAVCVAVRCSVLQCCAVWRSVVRCVVSGLLGVLQCVLQYVAVCCSVVQYGAAWCDVLYQVCLVCCSVCCSALQCVAVLCSIVWSFE